MLDLETFDRLLILFSDGSWSGHDNTIGIPTRDLYDAQVVIGIKSNGVPRVVKNRYGLTT